MFYYYYYYYYYYFLTTHEWVVLHDVAQPYHTRHTHRPGVVMFGRTPLLSTPTHQSGCSQSLADNGFTNNDVFPLVAAATVKFVQACSSTFFLT